MNRLRLANFGIRGFVGESLTPRAVLDFASAFGAFTEGGFVLVGCDTRTSSPMLKAGTLSALLSAGCRVMDCGVMPTPMLQHAVPKQRAVGAISISGGHNGMGWNTLSLIGPDGALLNPQAGEKVLGFYHAGSFIHQPWDQMGTLEEGIDLDRDYFSALEAALDVEAIRKASFTVVIDPVGGAGCPFLRTFADRLGLTLLPVNGETSGYLARDPEPRPRTARQLTSIVTHIRANVGFVLSSDMGRLSLVTETGEPVSEEATFPLILQHLLKNGKGGSVVVTNGFTSRSVDDLVDQHRGQLVKTGFGQAQIVSALIDEGGLAGGEGNGCVVVPSFSLAYDGFLMMGLVLEALAQSKKPLSRMISSLPRYHMAKRQIPMGSTSSAILLNALSEALAEWPETVSLETGDGVRMNAADGWVHARISRTDDAMRVTSESSTKTIAERRAEEVIRLLEVLA